MPTSPRDTCFVVHDFVGCSIFMPSCHSTMSAFRLVVVPQCVLHSSSTVPTLDFLDVRQLCFDHAQAEVQPYYRICTFLSSFKLFSTSCSWSNGGGSPASSRDSDITPTTTKRAKTFEKLPDWNFDQRDWCTDERSPKFAAAKKLRYHRKKRRVAAIISMLRCNYRYGPTYAVYLCTARTMSHVLVHMHNFRVPKINKKTLFLRTVVKPPSLV